jgi:hypothetical protein
MPNLDTAETGYGANAWPHLCQARDAGRDPAARVIADRRRAGQRKKPTAAQLAEWLGYSTKVVTQALQGIAGDVAFQQQAALPPART